MDFLHIFQRNRDYIRRIIGSLADEQLLTIPSGFDNNIAWNLGHLIVVHQSLLYRLSGLETLTTRHHLVQFAPGTSPADWKTTPDLTEIRSLLTHSTEKTVADVADGLFKTFTPYTTTTGFDLNSFSEAVAFNLYHEGLHFGAMMALRNIV